jgi:hypothetical protein
MGWEVLTLGVHLPWSMDLLLLVVVGVSQAAGQRVGTAAGCSSRASGLQSSCRNGNTNSSSSSKANSSSSSSELGKALELAHHSHYLQALVVSN